MPARPVTYVVADVANGAIAGEAQFETLSFTEALDRPGSWNARHNIDHPAAALLEPKRSMVYVDFEGTLLFGGMLWQDEDVIGEQSTSRFVGEGPLSLWRDGRRTVRGRTGMSFAAGTNDLEVAWTDADAFRIVDDLFAHAATFTGDPSFEDVRFHGPGVGGLSGVLRSRNLATYELKGIVETVEDLAAQAPTFDFHVNYEYVDGIPARFLDLHYPKRGTDEGTVFEEGKNVTLLRRARQGGRSGNVVTATGAGTGDAQKQATATDASLIFPAGPYPRLEAVVNHRDEELDDALAGHAAADLERLKGDVVVYELEVIETPDLRITDYGVGDTALVHIERGRVSVHESHRIVQRTVEFNNAGGFGIKVVTAEESTTMVGP